MACITKRRDRWVLDFYDQTGKRRRQTLPKGTTKTAAKQELRAIEEQISRRVFFPAKKMPLFSVVAREWIEYKRPGLRSTTWAVYEGHIRKSGLHADKRIKAKNPRECGDSGIIL